MLAGLEDITQGRIYIGENCVNEVAPRDRDVFLAAGAAGHGAIYTQSFHHIQILRKVILRIGSYVNWLVLKLH